MAKEAKVLGFDDEGFRVEHVDLVAGYAVLSMDDLEAYAFVQEIEAVEDNEPLWGESLGKGAGPLNHVYWKDKTVSPTYH